MPVEAMLLSVLLVFVSIWAVESTSRVPTCDKQCKDNEHKVTNLASCQKTCGNRLLSYEEQCEPFTGCVCDNGYVRQYDNATGPCIPASCCAPIPKRCGYNEVPSSCKIVCPPQSCDIAYTEYLCLKSECEPGCNCRPNYLRNSKNICILNDNCPPPRGRKL